MARFHRADKRIKKLRLQQVMLIGDGFNVQEGWAFGSLTKSRLEKAGSPEEARIACEAYIAKLVKDGWKRIVVESPPTKVGDKRRYIFNKAFFEIEITSPTQFQTSAGSLGKPANGRNVFNAADPVHAVWWAESVIAERITMGYELDAPKKKTTKTTTTTRKKAAPTKKPTKKPAKQAARSRA